MEAVLGQKIQPSARPGGQRRQQRGAALSGHDHLHDPPVPDANNCHILFSFSCTETCGQWCNVYFETKCLCHTVDPWLNKDWLLYKLW